MACKLIMTLLTESQEGDCGVDWKYDLDVKVFDQGLKGEGAISVPKHTLNVGETREPHGSPDPVTIYSGECLTELLIRLNLTATEVDLFKNDVGKASMEFRMECPGPGISSITREIDIAAGVRESPGILNKSSVFTAGVCFDLVCD